MIKFFDLDLNILAFTINILDLNSSIIILYNI